MVKAAGWGAPDHERSAGSIFDQKNNLVEDTTRVMPRINAIYRARAISTPRVGVPGVAAQAMAGEKPPPGTTQ